MEDVLEDAVEVANWKPENMVKGVKTMAELDKDVTHWPTPETRPDVRTELQEVALQAPVDYMKDERSEAVRASDQSQLPDPQLYPATIVQQD